MDSTKLADYEMMVNQSFVGQVNYASRLMFCKASCHENVWMLLVFFWLFLSYSPGKTDEYYVGIRIKYSYPTVS